MIERLNDLKKEGSAGFIGCCCEGFYCKHQDDFEKVDLPGLLIDIDDTTCYELGKEHEALIGDFENKTNIKLDLLTKVIKLKASERKHAI